MTSRTALLTFRIGPVHTFIAQARRVADLWTGSSVLSSLITRAIEVVLAEPGAEMVFPWVQKPAPGERPRIPKGLPNRFVCRVPRERADAVAGQMRQAVEESWDRLVVEATKILGRSGIAVSPRIWSPQAAQGRQTDGVLEIAWSWVPENGDYAAASREGARVFDAGRRFHPFRALHEGGEKCAVCGERTALPDGIRDTVRTAWLATEARSKEQHGSDHRFFRFDQTRLCLVCATKRVYPKIVGAPDAWFSDFRYFEPILERQGGPARKSPYFALIKVDGDRMGKILGRGAEEVRGGDVEGFHRRVSTALASFTETLRRGTSPVLDVDELGGYVSVGKSPQLVYAGGDDALVVCDPRDALPLAIRLRQRYENTLGPLRKDLATDAAGAFTLSGAILYAHSKHPAGLLFHDVEELLDRKAKGEAGRDAVALRLVKRGGVPVEVAFKWDEVDRFQEVVRRLQEGELSSKLSYHLRQDVEILGEILEGDDRWRGWLADRISRSGAAAAEADTLAGLLVPLFTSGRSQALRIARFLGQEVEDWKEPEEPEGAGEPKEVQP